MIVGENCPEFIVDKFGNRKKIHLQKSSEPDVLNGSSYKDIFLDDANVVSSWDEYFNRRRSEDKRPFLKFMEDEIRNKCQIPGETHSGEAEKI